MSDTLTVRTVSVGAPFKWLQQGYKDLYYAAGSGFGYGAIFALIGALIASLLYLNGEDAWLPVMWGGFIILAPVLATGFYVSAKAREAGTRAGFWYMVFPKTAAPSQLIILGIVLLVLFWAWGNAADKLAWLVGREAHSGLGVLINYISGTRHGMVMAALGIFYGGVLASIAYLISAISVPILVDRNVNVLTAIKLNLLALIKNTVPMLVWAALVSVITIVGLATAFLWFIFAFPWLGFASWRAYRDLVGPADEKSDAPNRLQSA